MTSEVRTYGLQLGKSTMAERWLQIQRDAGHHVHRVSPSGVDCYNGDDSCHVWRKNGQSVSESQEPEVRPRSGVPDADS